ncbi:exopolysaccharide Pel transporter PelG [Solibacillus silvestris]|uniref:exopolysaccharide Pel transporter PelG n=1 Tax=Solibacillus silvestris TaxID=76853 RepID=UPI003F7E15C8
MAGIGFELRKLYRKEGLVNNIQAYAYSTMTTIGPMILCLILVFVQQYLMDQHGVSYLQKELFVATLAYCFVFSIIITSGLSILVTRYIADRIYEKQYDEVINAYYGSLLIILPIAAIIAFVFLYFIEASFHYKIVAYLYFIELVVIWMQNVFMSALKDYKRIFRSFALAVILTIIASFLLFQYTSLDPVIIALASMVIGFASILILSSLHFEQVFPSGHKKDYFAFMAVVKQYPTIFFSGLFVYSGVYIHNIVYWLFSDKNMEISGHFLLAPFYDVPVFYAYLSVLPSLIFFVVIIETDFYERFLNYYKNVTDGGTFESLQSAKRKMQKTLVHRIGFLAEIQLLFSTLSIALGLLFLPRIGFTMDQIDIFITLCLAYFFFILMFVLLHILMYFDDRKGILLLSGAFIVLSAALTFITMKLNLNGMGMFLASFIGLCIVFARLMHILRNIDYYTYCPQPMITIGTPVKSGKRILKKSAIFSVFMLSILLVGCSDEADSTTSDNSNIVQNNATPNTSISDMISIDDKRIYERDEDGSIKTFYITILPDSNKPELDWYGLNRIVERFSEDNLKIILSEGSPDGAGPKIGMFGADATTANAKISLRGNSSRNQPQKSYKINLLESAGTWNDQTTINLNKHIADGSRLRNKLSFDLMEQIPNISSLRTQFVHLYVKDLTSGSNTYEDYGLYTHVEQPNKKFLRNHLFDPNGFLYKVTFFEFFRYPDQIKSHTDPAYNKEAFETILEIKGREEHDKLIQMLNDVNTNEIPINDVIDHHFDEENLLTWVAINILMDNMDTDANNFFIYSPLNINKWLILPWDYDDGWNVGRKTVTFHPYRSGISNFWGNKLLNRYFRQQENVDKLTEKIEYLYENYINEQTVTAQLEKYKNIPYKHITRYPDIQYLPYHYTDFEQELQEIIDTPRLALERYYADLEKPKPFYQSDKAILQNNEHIFSWDPSFDLQGDIVYYTAVVARDPDMLDVVKKVEKIRETEIRTERLPKGTYYLKVTVEDEHGNKHGSFDLHRDRDNDLNYFGVIEIEVTE